MSVITTITTGIRRGLDRLAGIDPKLSDTVAAFNPNCYKESASIDDYLENSDRMSSALEIPQDKALREVWETLRDQFQARTIGDGLGLLRGGSIPSTLVSGWINDQKIGTAILAEAIQAGYPLLANVRELDKVIEDYRGEAFKAIRLILPHTP